MNLSCDVADAEVILDGRGVGKSPLKSRLPVDTGPHELEFRSDDSFNLRQISSQDFRHALA